jgi:hypothetical protein
MLRCSPLLLQRFGALRNPAVMRGSCGHFKLNKVPSLGYERRWVERLLGRRRRPTHGAADLPTHCHITKGTERARERLRITVTTDECPPIGGHSYTWAILGSNQ